MIDLLQQLRYVDQEFGFKLCSMAADQIDRLESEVLEQCRINGMGAERELALLAKVERLERDNAKLAAALKTGEPVAWMIWTNGPVLVFMNKNEAELEFERLNTQHPCADRRLLDLFTAPPAQTLLNDTSVESCIKAVEDAFAWTGGHGEPPKPGPDAIANIIRSHFHTTQSRLVTTTPKAQTPMTVDQIDDLAESGCFLRNIYEIVREVELAHGIKD